MLLDPVALAWASWLGLAIGVTGCVISLVGLALTFREAKRAASAASLAREEVARVIGTIRSRNRLAALSSAVSRVDLVMSRIRRDALATNSELLTEFRRLLKEAFAGDPKAEQVGLELDQQLARVSELVWAKVDRKAKQIEMVAVFENVRTELIAHESTARMELDR